MYPHIIVAFNIERNTMIGKLFIDGFEEERYDHIYVNESIYDNSDDAEDDEENVEEPECLKIYDAGRDFMDNFLTGDYISIGTKWFNLPNYETVLNDFKKEFNIKPRKRIVISKIVTKLIEKLRIEV